MANNSFSGEPSAIWLTEPGPDRRMKLLVEFIYRDPRGRFWRAPINSVVDGASIPRALWTSVGSPYTGDYRRASIVHDVACATPGVNRKLADKMFYEACLCGGCSILLAKLLYAGVRIGAWFSSALAAAPPAIAPEAIVADSMPRLPGQYTPAELAMRAKYTLIAIELKDSSDEFKEFKKIVDKHLR